MNIKILQKHLPVSLSCSTSAGLADLPKVMGLERVGPKVLKLTASGVINHETGVTALRGRERNLPGEKGMSLERGH